MQKILIVDDDTEFLESMTNVLEEAGYSYVATSDSSSVGNKIRMYRPNLVILDVFLKEEDGSIIAKDLKSTFDTSSVPILLVSCSDEVKKISKKSFVDAFLHKPFSTTELKKIISQLVIKKQSLNLL